MEYTRKSRALLRGLTDVALRYGLAMCTLVVGLIIGCLEPTFFKPANLLNVLSTACLTGIAGMGLTCILATGETDFSVGSYMTIAACVMTMLLENGLVTAYPLALALGLAAALVVGLANSFLHIVVGIPTFIATVSMTYIASGVAKMITGGISIYKGMWDSQVYTYLGQARLFGFLPMPLVVLIAISAVVYFYTEKTRGGKCLYAVGANAKACSYLGISEKHQKFIGFMICALLCGVSGIVQASMSNGAGPYLGDSYFLSTLMVVMLGATLKRGVFNVPGTILGAVLISMINNGMTLLKFETYLRYVILGAILLCSVSIVAVTRLRTAKN